MAPQTPFYNLVLHPVAQAVSKSPLLPADFQAVTHKGPSLEQCPRSLVNSSFCHQEADSRTTHHDKRTERRPGTKKKKDILSQDVPGEAHTGMQQESSMRMTT